MYVEEISISEFNDFARNNIMKNFFQSCEYGSLMEYSNYSVMYIGLLDKGRVVAASLVLYKEIAPKIKYGYAPRGFLIDYYNLELLKTFTEKTKEFFYSKGFAFIKINPEVIYATLDFENKTKSINTNSKLLISTLKDLGYDKLKDNLYFESVLPKFSPIIELYNYNIKSLDPKILNEINEASKKGIRLVSGSEDDIETFYKFVEHKKNKTLSYYKYFYDEFKKSNMVDLLLIEVNYDIYVKYLQKEYIYKKAENDRINEDFHSDPNNTELYDIKMKSDKFLGDIYSSITRANQRMKDNTPREFIAGAFVVLNEGRVTIIITGQDDSYKEFDVKTVLFYKIIEEYQKAGYAYIDMYGITGDFNDTNPYKKLNDFKLKFKPITYEYIGEFDLITNRTLHKILWSTNKIQKEFYKPAIKNN